MFIKCLYLTTWSDEQPLEGHIDLETKTGTHSFKLLPEDVAEIMPVLRAVYERNIADLQAEVSAPLAEPALLADFREV